jgi:hypothetical protein
METPTAGDVSREESPHGPSPPTATGSPGPGRRARTTSTTTGPTRRRAAGDPLGRHRPSPRGIPGLESRVARRAGDSRVPAFVVLRCGGTAAARLVGYEDDAAGEMSDDLPSPGAPDEDRPGRRFTCGGPAREGGVSDKFLMCPLAHRRSADKTPGCGRERSGPAEGRGGQGANGARPLFRGSSRPARRGAGFRVERSGRRQSDP